MGKWISATAGVELSAEFTADGRFAYSLRTDEESEQAHGRYEIRGNLIRAIPDDDDPLDMPFRFTDQGQLVVTADGETFCLRRIQDSASPEQGFYMARCLDRRGIKDARGQPAEVFRVLVPNGWRFESNLTWKINVKPITAITREDLMAPAELSFRMTSPDGRSVFQNYPEVRFADLRNSPAAKLGLFQPGAPYGGAISCPMVSPETYLRSFVIPRQRGVTRFKVVKSEDVPALARFFDREVELFNSLIGTTGAYLGHRAAVVTVDYELQGAPYRESFLAAILYIDMPGIVLWSSRLTLSVRAPSDEFDRVKPKIVTSLSSFQFNTRWVIEYLRITDKNWRGIQNVDAAVRKIDSQVVANRERTNLEIHREFYPHLAPFGYYVGPNGRRAYLASDLDHQINDQGAIRSGRDLPVEPGWHPMKEDPRGGQ